ncbi:MAG TPA: sugar ABC transporter permease [Micromonosporaceae bacterium]|nr:sugar ABC transporter permease [Micromonosporaceae bacterium]
MALSDLDHADAPPARPVSTAAPKPGKRKRLTRLRGRDLVVVSLMLGIPIIVDLVLIWAPAFASIGLSFTSWNGIGDIKVVGWLNYDNIINNYPQFWPAVQNNLLWLAFLGVLATPVGLFFAVLLDKSIRLTRFYQGAIYMPVVLSLAIVGFIAQLVLSRDYGALNRMLGNTENPIDWLGDPDLNIWAILVAVAWKHVGYVMVLYLAGLKAVDPALKESAALDGANEVQTFLKVTFPTLTPINIIVLVITVIEALRAFDIVYAINRGRNGLELLSVLVTDNIVGEASRIGFGSAIAVILLMISMIFVVIYLSRVMREERS